MPESSVACVCVCVCAVTPVCVGKRAAYHAADDEQVCQVLYLSPDTPHSSQTCSVCLSRLHACAYTPCARARMHAHTHSHTHTHTHLGIVTRINIEFSFHYIINMYTNQKVK